MLPELNLDNDSSKHTDLSSSAARFYNMLHLASSNGQYNKLENGKQRNKPFIFLALAYLDLLQVSLEI